MTLSSATERVSYSGDGSTASFSVPFVFWDLDDLEVILRSSAGAETIWTRGTQYTLTGGSGSTGTLAVTTSPTNYTPASGTTLVIRSNLALTQDLSLPSGGQFPSASVSTALDKLVRKVQQVDERAGRALRFPTTDSSSLTVTLPSSIDRASKVLSFDASGNATVTTPSSNALTVSDFMLTVLDDATAAAARTTLGISTGTTVDIYVADYGPAADGVTDDTTPIANAIAALSAGSILRFSPGKTYVLNGTTNLNVANVTVDLRGATLKLKASAGNNAALLTIGADDVTVIGGTFDGNSANQGAATGQALIYHTGRTRVHVAPHRMTDSRAYGFRAINGTDCSIRDAYIDRTTSDGVDWEYSGTSSITRCHTVNCTIDRSDSAANSEKCIEYTKTGSATGSIVGCMVLDNRCKMHNTPTGSNVIGIEIWGAGRSNRVEGNDVQGSTNGISVANGQTRCVVVGNTLYDVDAYSIEIADSKNCAVAGNVIDGNANSTRGIVVSDASISATSNAVIGNTIYNTTDAAIYFLGSTNGCKDSFAVGNTINIAGASAYGIYSNVASDLVIASNAIDGNTTALQGIALVQCSYIMLNGNLIRNFTSQAIIGTQNAAGTMDYISIIGGLQEGTSGISITASGGGALGNHIRVSNVPGLVGDADGADYLDLKNSLRISWSTSAPEGIVTAGPGSMHINRSGAAGNIVYIKESGTGSTGWRRQENRLTVEVTVTHTDLAIAAKKTLVAALSGATWKIRNIVISGNGTNFSGGGGDRLLNIQDNSGTTIYSAIPVSTLKSLWPYRWGDSGLPWPGTAANLTAGSTAGEALVATYTGGTADYTAGSLTLVIEYERVT